MSSDNKLLNGKSVLVLGASRGVGREIVQRMSGAGAQVLAVARTWHDPATNEERKFDCLALNAASESAPGEAFKKMNPDVLVVCGGAMPPMRRIPELSWDEFTLNWEVDTKMAFLFCREALRMPLAPGSVVIIVSSAAGLGGSPFGGGYSGAKRMTMFLAKSCQAESDRRELGIRFVTLVSYGPMPETEHGQAAINGYARYLGIPAEKFVESLVRRPTPSGVAQAVLDFAIASPAEGGSIFTVSADGIAAAS